MAVGATMEVMVTADMMLVCERFGVFVPGVLNVTGRALARVKLQIENQNSCRVDRPRTVKIDQLLIRSRPKSSSVSC